jgi:hypothetical protein
MMPAGQSVQNIHDIAPAGEIVRRMSDEAEKILTGLADSIRGGTR